MDKGLTSRICKEFPQFNSRKTTQLKNGKGLFQSRYTSGQLAHDKMLIIINHWGNTNKTTMGYHFKSTSIANMKKEEEEEEKEENKY